MVGDFRDVKSKVLKHCHLCCISSHLSIYFKIKITELNTEDLRKYSQFSIDLIEVIPILKIELVTNSSTSFQTSSDLSYLTFMV